MAHKLVVSPAMAGSTCAVWSWSEHFVGRWCSVEVVVSTSAPRELFERAIALSILGAAVVVAAQAIRGRRRTTGTTSSTVDSSIVETSRANR